MKTHVCITMALMLLALLACQTKDEVDNTYVPIELDVKSASVVTSNNQFGFDLFQNLSPAEEGNLFISPLSVSQALSMVWNGATDQTATEIATVLGYAYQPEEINSSSETIREALLNADHSLAFSIANSIWYNQLYAVDEQFKTSMNHYYDAQIEPFDVANASGSLQKINGWVSDQTRGKIPEIITEISPENMMFLINAIYFKGQWQSRFDKNNTSLQPFFNLQGNESSVMMMTQKTNLGFTSQPLCTAVELPYGNGHFSMVVLLPKADVTLSELIASITADSWQTLTDDMLVQPVKIDLPKFTIQSDLVLNEPLKSLGMGRAFTDMAEFPNLITNSSLFISLVKHKTFVEVSEEGTEAAAVTSITMNATSIGNEPSVTEFRVDHPFVFAIREKDTGSIVFIGKVESL